MFKDKTIRLQSMLLMICSFPFLPEAIRSHILQGTQEKNRRLSDGYDFEDSYLSLCSHSRLC